MSKADEASPVQEVVSCPRCGAKTEDEAETICKPGEDECPMACLDDWDAALRYIQEMNEANEQYAQEFERQQREEEHNRRMWNNPTDDMLRDAGLK